MTRAARPVVVLAFALLYLSWGTTFYAIRAGVHTYHLPPALFSGVRVGLAGWLLLAYLRLRGEPLRVPLRELFWIAVSGVLLFVFGNGLLTVAMDTVPSGAGAVLGATTPLWMALLEVLWPWGERLPLRGWLGLVIGLLGVLLLLAPDLASPADLLENAGPLLILASACAWALASVILRYRRRSGSHLTAAAYQMIVGGTGLALVGVALGETGRLTPGLFTAGAVASFTYLLVVGSLIGFVAFNWLLEHVSATLVGTYAYVNPLVAIVVGWLLGGEELTGLVLAGMVVILAGVALVRGAGVRPRRAARPARDTAVGEVLPVVAGGDFVRS
jgi:drug/metabolite transporter (DMT)-like permease